MRSQPQGVTPDARRHALNAAHVSTTVGVVSSTAAGCRVRGSTFRFPDFEIPENGSLRVLAAETRFRPDASRFAASGTFSAGSGSLGLGDPGPHRGGGCCPAGGRGARNRCRLGAVCRYRCRDTPPLAAALRSLFAIPPIFLGSARSPASCCGPDGHGGEAMPSPASQASSARQA